VKIPGSTRPPRIHGELLKLGFEVAQSSVAKYIVKRRGPPSQGWRTFLRNHAPDVAALSIQSPWILVASFPDLSDMLRRALGEQITVGTVLGGGLWRANVDPNQLEVAIINLAVNARDAMLKGGKLTLETANVHLDSLGTALSSSGTGHPMKGPLFGTNPTIDREEAKVNKMIGSICRAVDPGASRPKRKKNFVNWPTKTSRKRQKLKVKNEAASVGSLFFFLVNLP
jgi:hypothetical protein